MTGNAFQQQPYSPPASKQSRTGCWIFAIVGGGVLMMALVCCGGGALLVSVGMDLVEEDLKTQVRDHDSVREHIGEITKFDVNFFKSVSVGNDNTFVYEVEGSKGNAEITIESTNFEDGESADIVSASMRLPNGDVFDLMKEEKEEDVEAESLPEDIE